MAMAFILTIVIVMCGLNMFVLEACMCVYVYHSKMYRLIMFVWRACFCRWHSKTYICEFDLPTASIVICFGVCVQVSQEDI